MCHEGCNLQSGNRLLYSKISIFWRRLLHNDVRLAGAFVNLFSALQDLYPFANILISFI